MSLDPFARAYVTTLFLLGERDDALVEAAGEHGKSRLVRALSSDDKSTRIATLAHEVARIALALEEGAIR